MDEKGMQHLPCEGKRWEPKTFQNSSFAVEVFRVLQSLRKDELLCDIKMETDDGRIIYGHKAVLASASPYFLAMFTNFNEKDKDHIYIKYIDYTSLELLINYIYSGKIIINKENALALLAAASFLSMDYVKDMCTEFLGTQLDPSNCIEIKRYADLHDCTELIICSEAYIKTKFLEVVKYDDFLCLSPEEIIEIISRNDLNAPLEQNVFESVMNWVKHESDSRKQYLKNVMAHVRLPLIPIEYLLNNVVGHPLIKISPECKNYVDDALRFNYIKKKKITIPHTIRCSRRSGNLDKVILIVSWFNRKSYFYWYDPANKKRNILLKTSQNYPPGSIKLIKDQFIFSTQSSRANCEILDLYSRDPSWTPMPLMKSNRYGFGVGIINHCVYFVGGFDRDSWSTFNSVVALDTSVQEWRDVASMSNKRSFPGVCVLNNILYAVGGASETNSLKSVECYDPNLNTWKPVAEMSIGRDFVSVGVLDGIIYAIGGCNEIGYCKTVEAYKPSDGFWTRVADLHFERIHPEIVILHGLMYVCYGRLNDRRGDNYDVEVYNPKTNTWTLLESSIKYRGYFSGALVIDRPPHFLTN